MRRILPLFFLMLGLLSPLGAVEARPEMPFSFENGFIVLSGSIAGRSETLSFLLDSGAGASLLDLPIARRLHLSLGRPSRVRGVESEATAYGLAKVPVVSADHELARLTLATDLHRASELCGRHIDGILGIDFFAGRIVQIDYTARCLRFPATAPAVAGQRLALRTINGVFCASISVNGSHPRWTRLDTGCNDSLHWVVPASEEQTRRGVSIGFSTEQRDLTSASVRLGTLALPAVETSLHGHPLFPGEAGLLGNGLLARWVVTVDAIHHQLSLE